MLLCQESPPGSLQLLGEQRKCFSVVLDVLLSQATSIISVQSIKTLPKIKTVYKWKHLIEVLL